MNDKLDSIDKRFDEVLSAMSQFANDVNGQFSQVTNQFSKVNKEISGLITSHDRLLNTIDGFIGRIDKYETELAARDHEIERLKRWINQIADKTGVELTS